MFERYRFVKELQNLILREGKVIGNDILKVDTFINYQVDPQLMTNIGEEFYSHFKDKGITKVITIESSGIAPALMTAKALGVPMAILKKQPSKEINENNYQTQVTSYTTKKNYELCLSTDVINSEDHVLLIDDFLADGEAITGAMRLIRMAHATVAGIGILIEKTYQPGHEKLKNQGIDVYSLVKIKQMDELQITFLD